MKIVIISTVMTSRVAAMEQNGCIGLIGDHKKFNVAITRGMALCVVIGQPYVLYGDHCWREFIEHCDSLGGYVGFDCHLLKRNQKLQEKLDADELLETVARMSLLTEGQDSLGSMAGGASLKKSGLAEYYSHDITWRTLL